MADPTLHCVVLMESVNGADSLILRCQAGNYVLRLPPYSMRQQDGINIVKQWTDRLYEQNILNQEDVQIVKCYLLMRGLFTF